MHLFLATIFLNYDRVPFFRFITALNNIILADQTYVNLAKSYITWDQIGSITKLFSAMIIEQLSNYQRYSTCLSLCNFVELFSKYFLAYILKI